MVAFSSYQRQSVKIGMVFYCQSAPFGALQFDALEWLVMV